MKNYQLILVSLVSILLFTACNKERKWKTEIITIDDITYNSMDFEIDYDLDKSFNQSGGIYLGIDPELNPENSKLSPINLYGSMLIQSDFDNLYANQVYYIQSFIKGEEEIYYSDIKSFKTLETPPLDCSVVAGQIYFSGHDMTESVGNLAVVSSETSSPFVVKIVTEVGDFSFSFLKRPKSGVYSVRSSLTDLNSDIAKPFTVVIGGLYSHGGVGGYYRAIPYEEIIVTSELDGSISISFCDLEFIKDGGGIGPLKQKLSGLIVE